MVVDDGSLLVDFTGSDPQGPHVVNCTYGVTASAVYNAIFQIVDNDVPHNEGAYRPMTVVAPPGTVTNVGEPAPSVGGNTETHPRLWSIVLGALSKAVPDLVAASSRRDGLQLPVRGRASRYRAVLRALPLRRGRMGRPTGSRRQRQLVHSQTGTA